MFLWKNEKNNFPPLMNKEWVYNSLFIKGGKCIHFNSTKFQFLFQKIVFQINLSQFSVHCFEFRMFTYSPEGIRDIFIQIFSFFEFSQMWVSPNTNQKIFSIMFLCSIFFTISNERVLWYCRWCINEWTIFIFNKCAEVIGFSYLKKAKHVLCISVQNHHYQRQ